MSIYFEKVSRFKDIDLPLPTRATKASAGYDLSVAEDIVIPPLDFQQMKIREYVDKNTKDKDYFGFVNPFYLEEIAKIVKENKAKPAMVSTGMKCIMPSDMYLEVALRSSLPLKHWLAMANSVGIIDAKG